MAIRGSPVVKDVYLDEQGNETLPNEENSVYLDDSGNDVPAPPIQFPGRKSHEQLLAEHQKNLMAQPQPQKIIESNGRRRVADIAPSPIDLGMEVLKAPYRAAKGVIESAPALYHAATKPADPENLKTIGGMAEGLVDTGRRALGVYATPKEQAGAIGDIATMALTPELPKAAKAATVGSEFAEGALQRIGNRSISNHMVRGKNQLVTALDASEHTAAALDNTIGDIHTHLQNSNRITKSPTNLPTFASGAQDTLDAFVKQNYEPIQKTLKDVPRFGELEKRGAELNDTLGRLGYYDKNPLMQSFARSSPEVQKVVTEANVIRAERNALIDQMAPVNVGAANLMRKWADLRQVSDMAGIAAKASEHSKRIVSATQPSATAARIAELVSAATSIGMGQPQIALAVRALKMGMNAGVKKSATLSPDILVARGFRNLSKGSKAIASPIPISAEPIKLPGATPAKAPDASGQLDMPFVEPEVGGIPQEAQGGPQQQPLFRTHGDVARESAAREANYSRTIRQPSQRALPPKREGPIVPSGAESINLPERPARLALPEPTVVDETPVPPVAGPKQPRERTPPSRQQELLQNFGGTVRAKERASSTSPALSGPILPAEPVRLPYGGRERRMSQSVRSVDDNAAFDAIRKAKANPEVAQRAAQLKDARDAEGASVSVRRQSNDALDLLTQQNPWIPDYLQHGRNDLRLGGERQ